MAPTQSPERPNKVESLFEVPTAVVDARVYGGKWILILGDRVVAASTDLEGIARAQKEKHPRSVLTFVEPEEYLVY